MESVSKGNLIICIYFVLERLNFTDNDSMMISVGLLELPGLMSHFIVVFDHCGGGDDDVGVVFVFVFQSFSICTSLFDVAVFLFQNVPMV